MRKKRPFTLIEIIISLGLTALVLTTLTYFFMQMQEINAKAEKTLERVFQIAYLQSRLSNVIPKAIAENTPKKDFIFYTTNESNSEMIKSGTASLVFTYDNGMDLNKSISNNVLGRLFVDNEKKLVLATWPSFVRWKEGTMPPMKKEILSENIDDLNFDFFVAPDVDRSKVVGSQDSVQKKKIAHPEPPGTWLKGWRAEYYELPAIMRVNVVKEGKPISFTFPLPNSNKVLFYYQ